MAFKETLVATSDNINYDLIEQDESQQDEIQQEEIDPTIEMRNREQLLLSQNQEINELEMEVQVNNKRYREESDDFTVVQRNKKQAKRRLSPAQNQSEIENQWYEVNVTSTQILLKQIAFAKLMRTENIKNIKSIKYKNPYKAIVSFENEESAKAIINCEKLKQLEYRCQPRNQSQICYGVVKDVDLGEDEKELLENFESEYEIISIKRLKRFDDETNQWVDSEAVRVGFLNDAIPSYIKVYGTGSKVYPYTFPVSQCSKCWKFGHLSRQCSVKKKICPKCAVNNHDTCDTTSYKCVNCGGPHKAFDRDCEKFIKEKEIRYIMCAEKYSYKQALESFLEKQKKECQNYESEREMNTTNMNEEVKDQAEEEDRNAPKSYRDAVKTTAVIHKERQRENKPVEINKKNNQKSLIKTKNSEENFMDLDTIEQIEEPVQHTTDTTELGEDKTEKKINFKKICAKIQRVFISDTKIEDKIYTIVKVVVGELFQVLKDYINFKDLTSKFFAFFVDG